jgi:hypothetical protein
MTLSSIELLEICLKETAMPDAPKLDPTLVESFVGNAHGDLEVVQSLLKEEPELLNAAWDWGGGDWETALGAASHMGRPDIAEFLIENGARIDIFAAAMLGQVGLVQAFLDAYPHLIDAQGPHGIPLAAHAAKGGEQASAVVALLEQRSPATTSAASA